MSTTVTRLDELEARFEKLRLEALSLQRQTSQLASQLANLQLGQGGGGGGGGGQIYYIDPVVIAAGGNVTGQTVYSLVSGSGTALGGTYTIYNVMAVATVATAGKTIIVAPNGDGSYLAVTQSC